MKGFVRVVSGLDTGRIGRYVSDWQGKAKVAYGYENDVLPFSNYKLYAHSSLSDRISKADLVDRYCKIAAVLKAVDLRGHPDVRKHSAEHTSLITEYNVVRRLLVERFAPAYLPARSDRNVLVVAAAADVLFAADLALDLELARFPAALRLYEWGEGASLERAAAFCDTVVFCLSAQLYHDPRFGADAAALTQVQPAKRVRYVAADTASVPKALAAVAISMADRKGYNAAFDSLLSGLED